ncbi:MAG: transporter [Frankiales bacterium]|nr:transporter [Frankiales bacterium]
MSETHRTYPPQHAVAVGETQPAMTLPAMTQPAMTHAQIIRTLAGLLTGMFVAILSSTVVTNALPTIVADLGGSQGAYTGIVTATLLAMTVSTPIWGKLSDLYSRKLLIQTALAVFAAGSLISSLAPSILVLIVGRALQGAGAGGTLALTQIIIAAMVSPRERGRYTGYVGAVFAFATIIGPLIGGVIVDTSWLGWRWCFLFGIPIAVASVAVIQRTLHLADTRREVVLDVRGALLIVASFSTLLVWISLAGNQFAWGSGWTYALVSAFVVLLGLAIRAEARAVEPVIPLHLFRQRTVVLATVASILIGVGLFTATIFMSQYFQLARGHSPAAAGVLGIPLVLGLSLTSLVAGRVITRTGRWKSWLVGGIATTTVGLFGMAFVRADTPYVLVALSVLLIGAGVGAAMQNLVLSVQNTVPAADLGSATATVTFFRSLGGAVGVSALGALLGHQVKQHIASGLAGLPAGSGDSLADGRVPNVRALAEPVRGIVEDAYGRGVGAVFLVAAPLALLALFCVLAIREVALRGSEPTGEASPAAAAPVAGGSLVEAGPGRHEALVR